MKMVLSPTLRQLVRLSKVMLSGPRVFGEMRGFSSVIALSQTIYETFKLKSTIKHQEEEVDKGEK